METIEGSPIVTAERESSEGSEQHLHHSNESYDHREQRVRENTFENVNFIIQQTGVQEVEDGHPDESVEEEGEMSTRA